MVDVVAFVPPEDVPSSFVACLESSVAARALSLRLCTSDVEASRMVERCRDANSVPSLVVDYSNRHMLSCTEAADWLNAQGALVLAPPAAVRVWRDKWHTHLRLAGLGFRLPATVLATCHAQSALLLEELNVGAMDTARVVCKPRVGAGGRGVMVTAGAPGAISAVLQDAEANSHLLQEFIPPRDPDGTLRWFRIFHCLGETFCTTWDPETHASDAAPADAVSELHAIALRLAAVSGYGWFSTEVVWPRGESAPFVIDPLNHKPFMRTSSEVGIYGVIDDVVPWAVSRIVNAAFPEGGK